MKRYQQCPKCAHAPLPTDQALPAACPSCGLILAKYAENHLRARNTAQALVSGSPQADAAHDNWMASLLALLFYVPAKVDNTRFWGRIALLVLFAIWDVRLIALDYRDGEMNTSFLHGPLLVFHEAGHVVFRLFGEFMMFLGGTLGQLIMPAILAGALLIKNRDPFGASIGLWLVGVSLLDVAPYVYDALQPQLMLLSGTTGEEGGHDWIYLLETMGLLARAHRLGSFIHKLGSVVVLLSLGWAGYILWKQRDRLAADVLHEEEAK